MCEPGPRPGSFGREEHDVNVNFKARIVLLQWRWHHQGSEQTCCFPSFLYLCLRGLYLCETPLELCKKENATRSSINIRVSRKCAKCQCCTNKAEQVYITIIKTLSAYKSPRWLKTPAGLFDRTRHLNQRHLLDIKSSRLECAAVGELAEFLGETFEVPLGFLKILVLLVVGGRGQREAVLDPHHRGEQHHRHLTALPESPCRNQTRHQ